MHEHVHSHGHEHALDSIWPVLIDAGLHAVGISLFVFLMMVVVDYLNVWSAGRLTGFLRGGRSRQYLTAGLLGSAPGCLGSFMAVTLYIRGMLGFGALCVCMIASSGDAAFIMLAEIPQTALLLFGILLVVGFGSGFLADFLATRFGFSACNECEPHVHQVHTHHCRTWPERGLADVLLKPKPLRLFYLFLVAGSAVAVLGGWLGPHDWNWIRVAVVVLLVVALFVVLTVPNEYLSEHLWQHITKRHLPKVLAWTLGTLVLLALAQYYLDIDSLISNHMVWMVLLAALIGILPDSGPHLLFVFLFASGSVPFSVLLTSSIVQDGHGMLPLLSVSLRDSAMVKLFNLMIGLVVGLVVYFMGY